MLTPAKQMDKAQYFFEEVRKSSLKAISKNRIEQQYDIAGHIVTLVFAGEALIPFLTPALEHLRCQTTQNTDLIIYLWDTKSTNTAMPPNDWKSNDYLEHGLIRGYNTEEVSTTFNLGSGTLNMYNPKKKTALFWVRDATQLPYYETGAPLRDIISWWAGQYGLQYAHAAAVGTKHGAVLLVGKGGSGKSTSALSCLDHPDLFYIGDDYVLIDNNAAPKVYSLYSSAKLNADHVVNFPDLLKHATNLEKLDTEKALLFVKDFYPQKIAKSMLVRAIILPHVTGMEPSSYSPTSFSAALMALAPSSMFQLPSSSEKTFSYFSKFVRKLPTYILHAGTHYTEISETIISILEEHSDVN